MKDPWKKVFVLFIILAGICGCGDNTKVEDRQMVHNQENRQEEKILSKEIANLYRDIYEQAVRDSTLGNLKVTKEIVQRLGEHGYTATDGENENQVNMSNAHEIEQFCQKVRAGENGDVTFFCIGRDGGFIQFRLTTNKGHINVTRTVVSWVDKEPYVTYEDSYEAYKWTDLGDGYLFFEQYFPQGYDGAPGFTAVRIQPLDEMCREGNRTYILPIGYENNDFFLNNWKEGDWEELNFNDLFHALYPYVYQRRIPYEKSVDGETYQVPAEEFETVIQSFFSIDKETLQKIGAYREESQCYLYRTRGFYDNVDSPTLPYPEVTEWKDRGDGTLSLTVHTVWPARQLSKAMSHEVVVRKMEDGSFQYVSNRVIPSKENVEPSWYTEQLSFHFYDLFERKKDNYSCNFS
ncbi:hypothetical protein D7X25_25910 [bacterium 1XD42-8]|nr:hypothetical protein D7X25_25910 [bacterium 1XD42-8]